MAEPTSNRPYQPEYQTRHDFSTPKSLHLTVVESLAAVEEASPTEVDPLYDAVDTDSLERLFAHATARESTLSAAFPVRGWTVTVHSDGRVLVHECAEAPEPSGTTHR